MTKSTRMMTFAGNLIAAVLLFALGACTTGTTISSDDLYSFYSPDLVQYVASRGDFPVLVIANPFGAGADGDLIGAMRLPGYYPPTPFTATTAQSRDDGHLVLVFNPIRASTGHAACIAPDTQAAPAAAGAAGALRLMGVFCYDNDVVSEAFLEMPRPAGLHDPAFRVAMAQLMTTMLPSRGRSESDCVDPTGANC